MITRYKHKDLIWIDLECPTSDEARQIMEEYNLHPIVAQELVGPSARPKVEVYEGFIYLILHFPNLRTVEGKRQIIQQEIDFIIGKNFIITSRYDAIDPLHQFAKLFEVNSILDRSNMGEHAGFIFFYMMVRLYDSILRELEYVNDSIQDIETRIFKGEERAMVIEISYIGRELLDFKRALNFHKETLESFEVAGRRFFGETFNYHLRAIAGEYYKADSLVTSNLAYIGELRETNNSLLNTKQNETMKILTIIAFLALPASVITNFFQMSTTSTPIVGLPFDWWIITGILVAFTLLLFLIARLKKWF